MTCSAGSDLDAVDVAWDRATRAEARDFSCWIQLTAKQRLQTSRPRAARWSSRTTGAPNLVTGKPASRDGYAPSTVAHSETVLRRFYDFHRDTGTGPVLNPFPLDASRRGRRHAHHNPMDEWRPERTGGYRPTVPKRIPRAISDGPGLRRGHVIWSGVHAIPEAVGIVPGNQLAVPAEHTLATYVLR
jgi:hypothetical protein